MKAQHTPGPWQAGINPAGGFSNSIVVRPTWHFPHGDWVADCGSGNDDSECMANARLIAAAPELLAALERMLTAERYIACAGEYGDDEQAARNQAVAAIAKAKSGEVWTE